VGGKTTKTNNYIVTTTCFPPKDQFHIFFNNLIIKRSHQCGYHGTCY